MVANAVARLPTVTDRLAGSMAATIIAWETTGSTFTDVGKVLNGPAVVAVPPPARTITVRSCWGGAAGVALTCTTLNVLPVGGRKVGSSRISILLAALKFAVPTMVKMS